MTDLDPGRERFIWEDGEGICCVEKDKGFDRDEGKGIAFEGKGETLDPNGDDKVIG